MAILDDFHEIAALAGGEAIGTPIVEDEEIDLDQHAEQPGEPVIAMREFEIGEQPRRAGVVDGVTVAAGLVRQRAGQPGLAHAAISVAPQASTTCAVWSSRRRSTILRGTSARLAKAPKCRTFSRTTSICHRNGNRHLVHIQRSAENASGPFPIHDTLCRLAGCLTGLDGPLLSAPRTYGLITSIVDLQEALIASSRRPTAIPAPRVDCRSRPSSPSPAKQKSRNR